jgi:hypothetical protein
VLETSAGVPLVMIAGLDDRTTIKHRRLTQEAHQI